MGRSYLVFIITICNCISVGILDCLRENSDEVIFPGPVSSTNRLYNINQLMTELELAKKLSMIESEEEFIRLFSSTELLGNVSIVDRFGESERSNKIKLNPAVCMTEQQVIPIKKNPDPGAIYFPGCIRINRCGGCCGSQFLSCQPTAIELRNYRIIIKKVGQEKLDNEIVQLEEHLSCKCNCKIEKKDCNGKQYYNKELCSCFCKNVDDENKCKQQDNKVWDNSNCSCYCKNAEKCSTGFYFDDNLCSCKNLPISNKLFDERTSHYFKTLKESASIVVPFETTNQRREHKEDPQ